jgi:hypothetical protein
MLFRYEPTLRDRRDVRLSHIPAGSIVRMTTTPAGLELTSLDRVHVESVGGDYLGCVFVKSLRRVSRKEKAAITTGKKGA